MRARRGRRLGTLGLVLGAVCLATLTAANIAWGKSIDDPPVAAQRPTAPAAAASDSSATDPQAPTPPTQSDDAASAVTSSVATGSVSLVNESWKCASQVNMDSVSVTMTSGNKVAIVMTSGCTGTIKNIRVTTNASDGIHVNMGAHDVTVGGGSIVCNGHAPGAHQDGIQAMAGSNVTFSKLTINCPTANNADLYVNWSGSKNTTPPSNIICVGCYLYGTQSSSAFVGAHSSQSGLKSSTICPSRYFTYRKNSTSKLDVTKTYPKSC